MAKVGISGLGKSCTVDIKTYNCTNSILGPINLIDVVGFGDSDLIATDDEIIQIIANEIISHSNTTSIHAILITESLTSDTQKIKDTLSKISIIFGPNYYKNLITLMTKGNKATNPALKAEISIRMSSLQKICYDYRIPCVNFPTNYLAKFESDPSKPTHITTITEEEWNTQLTTLQGLINPIPLEVQKLTVIKQMIASIAMELRQDYEPKVIKVPKEVSFKSCESGNAVTGAITGGGLGTVIGGGLGGFFGLFGGPGGMLAGMASGAKFGAWIGGGIGGLVTFGEVCTTKYQTVEEDQLEKRPDIDYFYGIAVEAYEEETREILYRLRRDAESMCN